MLKERHYFPIDILLDGDQPKEYIKAYFYYKNCPRASKPWNWDGYFAKFGGKSYPHESITEYLINKIGNWLGLPMNETRLIIANGQIRFLSKDFIGEGQKLVHGIEILAEYFEDRAFVDEINEDRKSRREYLTFDVVERAVRYVYPIAHDHILSSLIELITFDAIVGNNDRHFYNWGVIDRVARVDADVVRFSPIYDSARALLWNRTKESILRMHGQYINGSDELDRFILKSKPRFSFTNNPKANHFELLKYLSGYSDKYRDTISNLVDKELEREVLNRLQEKAYLFLCRERCILMEAILRKRFSECRKSLG